MAGEGAGEEKHLAEPFAGINTPSLPPHPPLINYCLAIFIFLICFAHSGRLPPPARAPCFVFLFVFSSLLFTYLSIFVFAAPRRLRHMAADQIMSNILPLQVFFFLVFPFFIFFAICDYPNVRPVESWSDNGPALPPAAPCPAISPFN